ncbi:MAG: PTS sugar transporter subunit IIA [Elusimicrobia bacterium]|nr:PTS sugar transporter subunit IIA [Elusimicrobiota bacterium]
MKLMDFIVKDAVVVNLQGKEKEDVLEEMVNALVKSRKISNKEKVVKILLDREELGSTGIGQGVGIPHGKTDEVDNVVIAFGSSKQGIEFESLDGEPVYLVFLLLAPVESTGAHLKALAKISRILKDKHFRQSLREATNAEEAIKIIKEEDEY